jgi:hypothetical protein
MEFDQELDREFIREFAVGGDLRGGSIDDRRERIRVAIYRGNLLHVPFRDSGMDYGQAYELCYRKPIELRRTAREEPPNRDRNSRKPSRRIGAMANSKPLANR